jgi:hypothetical protein
LPREKIWFFPSSSNSTTSKPADIIRLQSTRIVARMLLIAPLGVSSGFLMSARNVTVVMPPALFRFA